MKPPLHTHWPSEVLGHLSSFTRSLHVLLLQVEDCLPDPELDAYYRAIREAYEAMKVLERRTEWFADVERVNEQRQR
ncbi:MAG: hypothetical protein U0136_21625 [Bdellovibrionota bacterium]